MEDTRCDENSLRRLFSSESANEALNFGPTDVGRIPEIQEVSEASINAPPPVRSVDVHVAHCRPETRFPHWPAIAYF
jgi:hypothetical protein